jgi:hypothetical protein
LYAHLDGIAAGVGLFDPLSPAVVDSGIIHKEDASMFTRSLVLALVAVGVAGANGAKEGGSR